MKTAIVTDSNSGISIEEGKKLGIFILPMPVIIDGETYLDEVEITDEQFYEAMKENKKISTSQPALGYVEEMWTSILNEGYDEILHMPMTSGLSGSYQSAALLAEDFNGKVYVADNHRISVTQYEAALEAGKMADKGKTAKEIKEYLDKTALQASIYLTVGSLKYLQMGGRLSSSEAVLGTILNIKPVLSIQGEMIDVVDKVRGTKASIRRMIEAMEEDIATRFADIPREKIRIATAGAWLSEKDKEYWITSVQKAFPDHNITYSKLPCSIVCHLGPESMGIGLSVVDEA